MNDDGNNPEVGVEDAPRAEEAVACDDLRGRLMRQFEQWLDGMLAGESAPPVARELIEEALADAPSADSDPLSTDLYTLFASLTTLSGEIRLQGRAFKQLTDAVTPLAQLPPAIKDLEQAQQAAARQIGRAVDQMQPPAGESALPPSKEVLIVLFDLLGRLERGVQTLEAGIESLAAGRPRGLLSRLTGAARQSAATLETVQAMHEGYALTVSRLEAAVQQWGIERLGEEGDEFDPATMTAIEIDNNSDHDSGTVVEVYRNGYRVHGQLLATTQVKVAR